MPLPKAGSGSNASSAKQRLARMIARHNRLQDIIDKLQRRLETDPDDPVLGPEVTKRLRNRLAEVKGEKNRLGAAVRRVVVNHPNLRDFAANNFQGQMPVVTGAGGSEGGKSKGGDGGGGRDRNRGGDGGGGDRGGDRKRGGRGGDRRGAGGRGGGGLPGKRGKDYHIVRHGGKQYAVYKLNIGNGRSVRMAYRLTDPGKLGIDKNAGHHITNKQKKDLHVFGIDNDIKGSSTHPWQKYVRDLHRIYPNSMLRNREVMRIILEGKIERTPWSTVQARLKQTRWWETRTQAQRNWTINLSKEDRRQQLKAVTERVEDLVRDLFAGNKPKYVNREDYKRWAEKVASGAWGEPAQGFATLEAKLRDKAEKIKGTQAWIDKQEEVRARRGFMNQPEERFDVIREEAINALGYAGAPDSGTLMKWANKLVTGEMSSGDWSKYLRKRKAELYPYLDPNETWMDFASTYKNQAETLMGRTISFKDRLFQDLSDASRPVDPGEVPGEGKSRMALFDFQRKVRQDDRYWNEDNPDAAQAVYGIQSGFAQLLGGR